MRAARAVAAVLESRAVALWLGGLVVLGALVAPVVFTRVTMPQSADAMVVVFRRFDAVAMTCAAVALAAEAVRAVGGRDRGTTAMLVQLDRARATALVLAAGAAVYEGTSLSPRIAALHAAGAVRGLGVPGIELSRLHDWAEACGKAELLLLATSLALDVIVGVRRKA
jgi:hypothetical protein